jgi:hypothetical protein
MLYVMGLFFKAELVITALIFIIEFLSEIAKTKVVVNTPKFLEIIINLFKKIQLKINRILSTASYI